MTHSPTQQITEETNKGWYFEDGEYLWKDDTYMGKVYFAEEKQFNQFEKILNNHDALVLTLDVIANFNGGILTSDSAASMAQIARDVLKQIQDGE